MLISVSREMEWAVDDVLREKVPAWTEEKRRGRREEDVRLSHVHGADPMDIDDKETVEEGSVDDGNARVGVPRA